MSLVKTVAMILSFFFLLPTARAQTNCHLSSESYSGQVSKGRSIQLPYEFELQNGNSLFRSEEFALGPGKFCYLMTISELKKRSIMHMTDSTAWVQKTLIRGRDESFVSQIRGTFSSRISKLIESHSMWIKPGVGQIFQTFESPKTGFGIALYCIGVDSVDPSFVESLSSRAGFNVCSPTLQRLSPSAGDIYGTSAAQ